MFGDTPADYCEHEPCRLTLTVDQRIKCECGKSFAPGPTGEMFLRYLWGMQQRVERLEQWRRQVRGEA